MIERLKSLQVPELDLIILAMRSDITPDVLKRINKILIECHDPDYFLKLCKLNKVQANIFKTLSAFDVSINQNFLYPVLEELHSFCRFSWYPTRRRLKLTEKHICRELIRHEIPFILMKGLAFAEKYFEDPQYRYCVDVDLLVPEEYGNKAVNVALDAGFYFTDKKAVQKAKETYESKAEFWHPTYQVGMEISWSMTGNSGIGRVDSDMKSIWDRSVRVGEFERAFSDEDALLNLVRHLGHGHDFVHCLLKACMDVACLLEKTNEKLDWDYIIKEAHKTEFLRILYFFASFYERYYRDSTMPGFMKHLPEHSGLIDQSELKIHSDLLLTLLLKIEIASETPRGSFVYENLKVFGKFWALDSFRCLFKLLAKAICPNKQELVMLTVEMETDSLLKRRARALINPLLVGLPGIIMGGIFKIWFSIKRTMSKGSSLQIYDSNVSNS